jgi:DnaJ-class molecular chaperone
MKIYCETCEGSGTVYQEHQIGCHVGGNYPCPDCDGKGYIERIRQPIVAKRGSVIINPDGSVTISDFKFENYSLSEASIVAMEQAYLDLKIQIEKAKAPVKDCFILRIKDSHFTNKNGRFYD